MAQTTTLTPDLQRKEVEQYLSSQFPDLSAALTEMALNRPSDPKAFLGRYLLRHSNYNGPLLADLDNYLQNSSNKLPNKPLRIIIAGAACSGKGTQCELIKKDYGVVHISTGDLLRDAVAAGSDLGKQAKAYMDQGQLVPDDLIIGIVQDRLNEQDCKDRGWLLDGFPRSPGQADALNAAGVIPDIFLVLDVPDEVLIERVTGRRLDPVTGKIYHLKFDPPPSGEILNRVIQRSDDTEAKIRVRLDNYKANVASVESRYTAIMKRIDGNRKKESVYQSISFILSSL